MATLRIRTELRGTTRLNRVLDKLGRRGKSDLLKRALFQEAEAIMAEAKVITPVDTGALRASGHVQLPKVRGETVSVTMGYGGAAAPYAVFVHERTDLRHKPPTRAKFLEEPFRRRQRGMLGRIASMARLELETRKL